MERGADTEGKQTFGTATGMEETESGEVGMKLRYGEGRDRDMEFEREEERREEERKKMGGRLRKERQPQD